MPSTTDKVQELLNVAAKLSGDERRRYLDEACAGEDAIRREVESLLAALDRSPDVFETAAVRFAHVPPTPGERPGDTIGRYKLLQVIGEGGFGTVYMAEQTAPVRRHVALKIIKLGMDTRQVIARFEAERQALALMDHPNIAKVHDAGATDAGRPYFVMELVKGIPINGYCDEHRLDVRQRLALFADVCSAVQHAHQKGIIHRDLKPTNVLVTVIDDKPVPKVIDFGIAKATAQQLTERTLFTELGQLIGTPEYMSPEQADVSAADVDTRSDVYSLGVLLYELLVGTTPFDPRELRSKAFAEMQRVIKEVDPPRPSARLTGMKETSASIASVRQVEPQKLGRLLRGELDWVVMKCLAKARNRRYPTASELAADVGRFLAHEPVAARPASAWYRLRTSIRRHGVAAAVIAVVAISVSATAVISTAMYGRAETARRGTDASRISEAAQRTRAESNLLRARQVLDRLTTIAEHDLPDIPANVPVRKAMLEDVARYLEAFHSSESADRATTLGAAEAYLRAATIRQSLGEPEDALRALARVRELCEGLLRRDPADSDAKSSLGRMYAMSAYLNGFALMDAPAAETAAREVRRLREEEASTRPSDPRARARADVARKALCGALLDSGKSEEALVELRAMQKSFERVRADFPDDPDVRGLFLESKQMLARCLGELGLTAEMDRLLAEVEAEWRRQVKTARAGAGDDDDDGPKLLLASVLGYRSVGATVTGRQEDALKFAREQIELLSSAIDPKSPYVNDGRKLALAYENESAALQGLGRAEEAAAARRRALETWRHVLTLGRPSPSVVSEYVRTLLLTPMATDADADEAVRALRPVAAAAPRAQVLHIYLGVASHLSGDETAALQSLSTAQGLGPRDLDWAWAVMAMAQHSAGREAEARASLAKAEAWGAKPPALWYNPRQFLVAARERLHSAGSAK